ncbi:hypothetical protein B7463_g3213, partial [Scytalidium lignicola]
MNEGGIVEVPLYADINYLCGNEDQCQWDKAQLKSHGDFQGHAPDEIARFFQSRLYFGFLHRFFEGVPDFTLLDFVIPDGRGNHVVTTSRLQSKETSTKSSTLPEVDNLEGSQLVALVTDPDQEWKIQDLIGRKIVDGEEYFWSSLWRKLKRVGVETNKRKACKREERMTYILSMPEEDKFTDLDWPVGLLEINATNVGAQIEETPWTVKENMMVVELKEKGYLWAKIQEVMVH